MKPKNTTLRRLLAAAVTLTFSVTVSHAASLFWDGTTTTADADGGAGTWSTAATANWATAATGGTNVAWTDGSDAVFGGVAGTVTVTGTVSVPSISFGTTNASAYTVTGGNITLTGTPTITATTNATISSILGGTVGMTKAGAGSLSLTGTHTYTGGTIVNAGTLAIGTGGGTGTIRGAVTVNTGGTFTTGTTDALGYNAGFQVDPLNVNGGTFNNTSNGNQGFRTNLNLTAGTVSSTGGGSLNFTVGYGITNNAAATTSVISAGIVLRDNLNMGIAVATGTTASGADLQISGIISGGGGAITKTGAGNLLLSGANTFTGTTSVSAGNLRLGNTLALQSSTLAAGAVVFDQSVASHAFTIGGLSTTSNMTLADNATTPNAVALSIGANTTTYPGILSGAGSLIKVGAGNVTLTGLNTYSGGTTVNAGTLTLGAGGGTGTIRGTVTVNSGATLALTAVNSTGFTAGARVETLNINGGTVSNTAVGDNTWATTFNLTGGLLQSNGGVASTAAGPLFALGRETTGAVCAINSLASNTTSVISGRLHIRENNANNQVPFDVADGGAVVDLQVNAAITENGGGYGIVKTNGGLMNLAGPAIYTGNTTINGGVLQLARSGTLASSPVVVNATGTFRVEAAGATLAAITANNTSTLSLPVVTGGTTNVTGALTLGGGTINVSPMLGNVGLGTYDLITAGSITGSGTPLFAPSGAFGSSRLTGSVAVNGNKLQLTLTGLGANLTWNNNSAGGNVAGTWDLNNLLNFANGAGNDVFKSFDSVTFDDTIAGAKTITLSGALAPSLMTINSSAAYSFTATSPLSGSLVGNGSLVKSGSGTATIAANVSYGLSGDVTVAGGTLDFSNKTFSVGKIVLTGGTLNNATVTTTTGLDLQSGSTNAAITSTAAWTKSTAGTVTLTGTNTLSGQGTISAGTLNVGTSVSPYGTTGTIGTSNISIAAGATLAGYRANATLGISGSLSGAGSLVLVGGNTGAAGVTSDYNISGVNTAFSGAITVTGARLYSSANNIGTGTATNGLNGAFLLAGGGTYPNAFFISGNGWGETLGVAGALRYDKGSTTTGTVTLTGNTRINAHGNTGNIAGPIVESGGVRNLELGGTSLLSTFNMSAVNTYTGTTTLTLANVNLTGSLASSGVTVAAGSGIGGTGTITGTLAFASGGNNLYASPANTGLTVNGNVTLGSPTTVNLTPGGAVTPSGVITVLKYNSTITGTTANLALANAANYRQAIFSVGANKITLDIGGKTLFWGGNSGGQWTIGTNTRWNTTGAGGETDAFFQGDSVTFDDTGLNPAITLTGILQPNALVVNSNTNNYTFTETATNYIAGNTSLIKNGSSNLTLVGASNTFTGGTVVNGGTLTLSTTGGAGTVRGPLVVNSGATVNATVKDAIGYTVGIQVSPLTLNGGTFNNSFNDNQGYTTNVIMTGGSITSTGGGSFNFAAGYGITSNASSTTALVSSPLYSRETNNMPLIVASGTTASGIDLDITGIISGNAVTKSGAGTLRVSGANNYTAGTTVAGGKLLVNNTTGSGTGTGAVTVAASTTLGGTGIITGTVTAAGTIAPGQAGTGTLTTGATALTGTLAIEVDGANADKLVVNGNLTLGGSLSLSTLGGGFTAPSYVIATYTGTLTGTFASAPLGYTVTYDTTNKQILIAQASGYAAWASGAGLTAGNSGPTDDPDHDGLSNLLEYVLLGNPLGSSQTERPTVDFTDPNMLHFYFLRSTQSKQDINVTAQWGNNLGTWNDIAIPDEDPGNGTVVVEHRDSTYDLITVNIPRSNAVNGKIFVRIKATPKP